MWMRWPEAWKGRAEEACGSAHQTVLWSPMASEAHCWILEMLGTLYCQFLLLLTWLTATSCPSLRGLSADHCPLSTEGQQHAQRLALRPLCIMRSFREEETTSEELSTMGRGPEEPPGGCNPEDQIQSVAMGLSTGQERTGPEEVEATVRGGEYRS